MSRETMISGDVEGVARWRHARPECPRGQNGVHLSQASVPRTCWRLPPDLIRPQITPIRARRQLAGRTGGGGGNRTRVRRQIHVSLYVRSLQFWSRPPCSPRTGSAEDPPLDFAGDFEALTTGYPPVNDALLKPLKAQATEDELLLKQPVRLVGRHFLVCHSFYELLAISARNLHSTIPVEPISPPHHKRSALHENYKQFPGRSATNSAVFEAPPAWYPASECRLRIANPKEPPDESYR